MLQNKHKIIKKLLVLTSIFSFNFFAHAFEFEEDHGLPIVYLNLVLDSGSVSDTFDRPLGEAKKQGLANIALEMLLRGTEQYSKTEFLDKLSRIGGQIEIDTRSEGTVISGAVLSEHLPEFLSLLTQAIAHPKFNESELQKLKNEIVGHIQNQKSSDKALVSNNFAQYFYKDHPYSNSILGKQKAVESIRLEDVQSFYNKHVGSNTIELFGSGDANAGSLRTWFEGLKNKLKLLNPASVAMAETPKPRSTQGRQVLLVDKPQSTQAQILIGGDGFRPDHEGFYAIMLANHSFGGGSFQARLMKEIRVKRGWTYGASNRFRYARQPMHYAMYFFPKNADAVPAIKLSLDMLSEFAKNGITQEEFNFARTSLSNNAPFDYDTSKKRLENATSEYLNKFPRGFYKNISENLKKVKFEDVNKSVSAFFKPENLVMVVVGDASILKDEISKIPGFAKLQTKSYLED